MMLAMAMAAAFQLNLLIIIVFCSVGPFFVQGTTVSANDVAALQGLLREWQEIPGAVILEKWSLKEDADPCGSQWKGVVCSPSQSVISLHLGGVGLRGGIPTAIGGLEELKILDLSGNPMLTSTIPNQIGHLRRLTHLSTFNYCVPVTGTGQTSDLPTVVVELTYIKLSGCNFTGKVPQEIYNLNNLKYLDLSNNPHLLVDLDAQPLISLRKEAELLSPSCHHLVHHRTLLQSPKSNNNGSVRRNLPMFYTYIALGCVGFIFLIFATFCCCRYMSVRKTRSDTYLGMPQAPSLTTFQSKPRSIHIANKNSDVTNDRH